jgi:hypothetical protein
VEVMVKDGFLLETLRCTRNWIHYGVMAHVILCVVVAAARHLLEG